MLKNANPSGSVTFLNIVHNVRGIKAQPKYINGVNTKLIEPMIKLSNNTWIKTIIKVFTNPSFLENKINRKTVNWMFGRNDNACSWTNNIAASIPIKDISLIFLFISKFCYN